MDKKPFVNCTGSKFQIMYYIITTITEINACYYNNKNRYIGPPQMTPSRHEKKVCKR